MRRRQLAEGLGTFGIVFAPCCLSATSLLPGGAAGLSAAAIVSGLAVAAMIAAFGPISSAHFNPAVTIAFALAKRFPWAEVKPYVVAQGIGAVLASGIVTLIFGTGHGVHRIAVPALDGLALEVVISAILMMVILLVSRSERARALPPLAIGLTVTMNVYIAGPATGGSMNPFRSLAPAFFATNGFSFSWVYIAGPVIGTCLAALTYRQLQLEE